MATYLTKRLIGKNVTIMSVTTTTVDGTTGAITDGTTYSFVNDKKGITDNGSFIKEDISGDNSTKTNHVVLAEDPGIEFDYMFKTSLDPEAFRAAIVASAECLKVSYKFGVGGGAVTRSEYMSLASITATSQGRGAITGHISLESLDTTVS